MDPQYEVEPLGPGHDRAAFSCGVEPLDRYLKQQASQEMKGFVAAVFVLRPIRLPTVIAGYYTLSASVIVPAALPPKVAKKYPRYSELPAVLLGRLAVDSRYRGQGLGRALLLSAMGRSLRLRENLGTMALIVDAKDDSARSFYEHYDFRRLLDHPYRLYLPMSLIAELLGE